MSKGLIEQLGLEHWCDTANALTLQKEQYWYWNAVAASAPQGDHMAVMLNQALKARVEDAFPLQLPRRPDVVAAFEAMLLAGKIARAYEYIRGPEHSFTTFKRIRCDHSSDYVNSKTHGTRLTKSAVRIAEAVIDNDNSVTVLSEQRTDRQLVQVRGAPELLHDLGLMTAT